MKNGYLREYDKGLADCLREGGPMRYSHEAFQKAIFDNPHDQLTKGAYADWLEENDPTPHNRLLAKVLRGDVIRDSDGRKRPRIWAPARLGNRWSVGPFSHSPHPEGDFSGLDEDLEPGIHIEHVVPHPKAEYNPEFGWGWDFRELHAALPYSDFPLLFEVFPDVQELLGKIVEQNTRLRPEAV